MEEANNQPVLSYQEMKPAIAGVVAETKDHRKQAAENCPTGARLRRTPFDSLDEKGILTPERLTLEWDAIQRRQSDLPSSERRAVTDIITRAMRRVLVRKAKEKQEK